MKIWRLQDQGIYVTIKFPELASYILGLGLEKMIPCKSGTNLKFKYIRQ